MNIQNSNGAKNTAKRFVRRTNSVKNQEDAGILTAEQASAELKSKNREAKAVKACLI